MQIAYLWGLSREFELSRGPVPVDTGVPPTLHPFIGATRAGGRGNLSWPATGTIDGQRMLRYDQQRRGRAGRGRRPRHRDGRAPCSARTPPSPSPLENE
jgi:hypothetical protein